MTLWDISVEEDVRKLIFNPTKYMQNINYSISCSLRGGGAVIKS